MDLLPSLTQYSEQTWHVLTHVTCCVTSFAAYCKCVLIHAITGFGCSLYNCSLCKLVERQIERGSGGTMITSTSLWGGLNLLKHPAVQENRGASLKAVSPAESVTEGEGERRQSCQYTHENQRRHGTVCVRPRK